MYTSTVLRRAFDKAVRTKPPVFAADAGPMQGIVAVSDATQLEKIKKEASEVKGLGDKLKYWAYTEVLDLHESLEAVYAAINKLSLVPEGF